jgi:hypothetical protein
MLYRRGDFDFEPRPATDAEMDASDALDASTRLLGPYEVPADGTYYVI